MGAACKIWANSIGSFPRSGVDWKKRLKLIFEKGLGLGALPRPRKLRWTVGADHLGKDSVAYGISRYFRRKAGGPPAYGRRAWSKVVSYLMVFRYVFRFWSELRRCLTNKTFQRTTSYAFVYCVTAVEYLVEFQHLEILEVHRCWKKIFWTDCFRWP